MGSPLVFSWWGITMRYLINHRLLTLVRDDQLIFAELKSAAGKLTDSQAEWLGALSSVEYTSAQLWRANDLETVAELLRRR